MALVSMKPTSAGRRHMVKVVHPELHKGKPFAALTEKKNRINGRDNFGHITTRHKGGGHKRAYRLIDFLRNKDGIPARVERIEYDPNRSAHIALVLYADGERRYIIAPKGLTAGSEIVNGSEAAIKVGNCLPLRNIPVGTTICCVELFPGKGAQLARAAGSNAQLIAREGEYAQVRLRSGEVRRIGINCRATIGVVSNDDHNLRELGKAGANRWRGIRPTVRGVVMNPVDHPHGGGEGKTGTGRAPVTPWGQLTRGYRTRNNKRTDSMIVQRRYRK
ncbi:50S ribosomal protein L2 [Mesosutterella sp. OilRF-GAM-744-9]|uniref:Large ribosomal subunit protein uL2 n=2 Tax=Mesosutterella TaxID=2494213 RepID=A0ABS9MS24_9BURK|nr:MULTISPECIES: 50S ribosomal protein L2 [unclassified Mesosutterella]MCG5031129.1 50S ribosomal protein L2 [Mesosutterella sp. oilRF-744-WT-GAM-9]MCI6530382.1 50S ribosomal protein L2 [Mesosutterella sp.]MDL2058756.1 50S ribosomal protein L2 [Mesosutterella sp. AGMB02718]